MKSFDEFKHIINEAKGSKVSASSAESRAQKELEAALKAQAEASIQRDEDGKPIPKNRPYYLQNNPTVAVLHRIKQDAANAAVLQAQSRVTMAQQQVAAAQQAKAAAEAPQPVQEPAQGEEMPNDAMTMPTEPEAPVEAPEPLTPEQEKEERKRKREAMDFRKTLNRAQRDGLDGKYWYPIYSTNWIL